MKVKPNFSESAAPNKPGVFVCQITQAELKYGKTSGLPYINWKLKTQPENRVVFHSTPLQGKGSGMFKHFVHSAGDTTYEEGEYETNDLIDKLVSMKLAVDDNGYFVVKEVTPLSDQQVIDYKPVEKQVTCDDIAF